MSANYSISSFSSKWEKSVKKPEDIFFSITMGTISEYFIEAIQNKKQIQSNSYQRDLLKMLQDRVNNSIESNILKKVSPKTIQNLSVTLPSQPRVKDFKKEIKSVNSAYKKFSFIRAAKNELFSIIDQNRSDLEYDVCMNYLHRGLLFNYSAKFLEKAPEILFPKIFFSKYHNQMEKEIFKNNSMKKHMSKIIEKYKKQFSKRNSSKKTKKLRKELMERISLHDPQWEKELFYIIHSFKTSIISNKKIYDTIKKKTITQAQIFNILKNNSFFEELIEKIILKIILCIAFQLIGYKQRFFTQISKFKFCTLGTQTLKKIIDPHNTLSQYETFDYTIAESSFFPFLETMANLFLSKYPKREINKLKKVFCEKLSKLIIDEKNKKDISIDYFLQRFSFNIFIKSFCKESSYQIYEDFNKMSSSIMAKNNFQTIFRNFFQNSFFRHLESSRSIRKIPYLTKTNFKFMLNSFFNELEYNKRKIRVGLLIGGIDLKGKCLKLGNVTLYDPRIWDFGEDTQFDSSFGPNIGNPHGLRTTYDEPYEIIGQMSRKRNSARAVIEVFVHDYYSAIREAEVELRRSLDTLVYASTARNNRGFKPQIPVDYVFLDLEKLFSSRTVGPRRQDYEMISIDSDYEKILSFYNILLNEQFNSENQKIERAFDWYHRGHWSDLSHQKFISQWIALEQLLTKNNKNKGDILLKFIPKFVTTWTHDFSTYGLRQWFTGITKELEKNGKVKKFMNSNSNFEGWESNHAIIFEKLNILYPQLKGEAKKCADLIQNELTPLKIREIKKMVKNKRSHVKFKIALLYAKRNALVHEAATYSTELEIMTNELEKILVSVLSPIISHRKKKTIEKIIFEHNRPFHVRDSKY